MNRPSLGVAVAIVLMAAMPAMARQNQDSTAQPGQQEIVPLQVEADQIRDMQQKLNQQGFSAGQVDGLWGPNTSAALRRYQARNGLQQTGELDQKTLAVLGANSATPAAAASSTQGVTIPGPTNVAPVATSGRVLGTNPTSAAPANPLGTSAGVAAASGDTNQAVATTNADAAQPARGANSFSMGEARRRIASKGFQNVADLHKDNTGVWRSAATRDGQQVQVWLDYKGNVGQQ